MPVPGGAAFAVSALDDIRSAVFVSPHLDDVAFSCGGTAAQLARRGVRVTLATVFTRSVARPSGFALACQTDKGLAADVDYMALRRAEDVAAARCMGVADVVHLDLPEAPHREYGDARELFAGVRGGDEVWREASAALRLLVGSRTPDAVFVPQGLGGHVDHLQVIRACAESGVGTHAYRDTPYALRVAFAPAGADEVVVALDASELAAKLDACCAYATQLGFQFGGADACRAKLEAFARAEARASGRAGWAERFDVLASFV